MAVPRFSKDWVYAFKKVFVPRSSYEERQKDNRNGKFSILTKQEMEKPNRPKPALAP